ncbi:BZ3500_MvSof-1268-A1-R1_Chr1-3g02467 [Microbotryum saponariae]|uniref:BZ3500_MvSof-1268-A1-R1_Chr1-3g02467 protein n=1 Tax=Microbotryum saponariae TaxID=289078 RepID=A0A2X0MGA0_9BASI|nr:BZ3500_MvSof-1268-A1-R1_Chr1-3g02467 [Microbotryum saponariae]SCZ96312.1 BZ3501_MvSof-1269-A2-R1_Chr1-3g02070 [Microbotryum saponariae]
MKKVFGRKKSNTKLGAGSGGNRSDPSYPSQAAPPPPVGPGHGHSSNSLAVGHASTSRATGGKRSTESAMTLHSNHSKKHVDDFGRPIDHRPAFGKDSLGLATHGSGQGTTGAPNSSGLPSYAADDDPTAGGDSDMQLLFGYAPIETLLELSVERVLEVVVKCSEQIRARGVDTPLILSSMSLDLTMEGTCSLIRSYLADPSAWTFDLTLASPLCVGAQMKWALARLINDRGGRGFVSWDLYDDFKHSEKAAGYPPRHCSTHLIARLATSSAKLLTEILSLFSSISAHSKANGMPPRKLASLFSPYIFGLADDETFDATYEQWQRLTDATEHILLSYIRNQQAAEGSLPTHLEKHIIGYPQTLNINYSNGRAVSRLATGARVEEVVRIRRLTRFHSRNLIASAGTWSVPNSSDWALFFPRGYRNKSLAAPSSANPPATQYTPHFRHLLNIRGNNLFDDEDDDGELQRYKSTVEKDWSKFGELGFKDVEAGKLEFDLTESERTAPIQKRDTMDWGTFASSGFGGRESFKPNDLIFHQSINTRVNTWPASQQALDTKLRAAEKMLPSFPYDTTPREEARVVVDALFFEAWADVLVSGGWARDELKESSFALIHWKSRPRDGERPKGRPSASGDDRTEDRWVLVEEFVPKEYRDELTDGKQKKQSKRISFMRSVRKKTSKTALPRVQHPMPVASMNLVAPPISSSYARTSSPMRTIDESVFNPGATTPTKTVSLSRSDIERATIAGSTYAPSITTTVGPNRGHGQAYSGMPTTQEEGRYSTDAPRSSMGAYGPTDFESSQDPRTPTMIDMPPPVPAVASDGTRLHGVGVIHSQASPAPRNEASAPAWIRDRDRSGSVSSHAGGDATEPPRQAKLPSGSGGGAKGFLSRMTSRNKKPFPAPAPPHSPTYQSSAPRGRVMPLTAAALAQHSPPAPMGSSRLGDTGGVPGGPEVIVHSPSVRTLMQRSESGGIPPPLPPKTPDGHRTPTIDEGEFDPSQRSNVRDSVMTTTTMMTTGTDAYGGIESIEEEGQVGRVMYRGSDVNSSEGEPSPRRVLLSNVVGGTSTFENQQQQASGLVVSTSQRHDSLPPSPKPDAEVPVDVGRDSKFMSGTPSQLRGVGPMGTPGGRVGKMIGKIEEGNEGVRLTQYGF